MKVRPSHGNPSPSRRREWRVATRNQRLGSGPLKNFKIPHITPAHRHRTWSSGPTYINNTEMIEKLMAHTSMLIQYRSTPPSRFRRAACPRSLATYVHVYTYTYPHTGQTRTMWRSLHPLHGTTINNLNLTIHNTVGQCVCVHTLVVISYILFLCLPPHNLILTIHSGVAQCTRGGVTWHDWW